MRVTRGKSVGAVALIGLLIGIGMVPVVRRAGAADDEAASMRLVLNLAARRLHVYENGDRTRSYTVSIGKPGHRTPVGSYRINKVVWNPWWHPPDRKWARGKKVTPPGPSNPMGRVKMYFRELYYIHGTPETGSLGRAVSHGCVRMSNGNAIALARLVHSYGSPNVSKAAIDRLANNSKQTRTIMLTRPIPFEVISSSAEVHDGRLEIYASDGEHSESEVREDALRALAAAGIDPTSVDQQRLIRLVRLGQSESVSAPLVDLRAPTVVGEPGAL